MLFTQFNYSKETNNVSQRILLRILITVIILFNIAIVSNAVTDTAYPTKPKNIRTEEVSGFRITISWEPSTDDVGVVKYIIFRGAGAEEIGNILPEPQTDGRVYFSTTDVKPGQGLSYLVRACDAAGKKSDAASIWIWYNLPIPNSIKVEHIKLSEIYFTWSLNDPNKYVEGISVYKNGVLIATLSPSQSSYLDSSLGEERIWEYQLGTYDKAGNKLLTDVFKIANTPFNGLRELMRRKNCETVRPANLLVNGLILQPELLHYKDTEYGTHVWRISNSSRCNTFAHNHINRTPWNANGSKIGLISDRCFPKYWCRENGCTGNTLLFVIDTDGGNFRHIPIYNNPFSCWCPDYQAGRMRHFVWDRFYPQYAYFSAKDGLYRMDMSQSPRYEKISDFPEKERYKVIYCLPSEQNVIMVIDDLAYKYPSPKFYFINLNSPNEVISYPISLNLNFPPEHDLAKEYSFHDIYFTRSNNNDFTFMYGPVGSLGEPIMYRSSMDGLNVRLWYDGYGRTILDSGIKVPYHSHPSWGPEGNLSISTYFGEQYPKGSNKWGWQIADDDKGIQLKQLAKFSGGHTAWDGYDPDFLFASVNINTGEARIIKAYVSGPENNGELFVNPCTSLTDEKDGYQTLPRPAQSPDGTKVFYHSSMSTDSDQYVDSYIAVARYPMPAQNVHFASENQPTIIWDPPKFCRETRGYHVYRTLDPAGDFTEVTDSLINALSFTDLSIIEGTDAYYYAVTSEEWSGLESNQLSNIIKVEYNNGYYTSENFAEEGKKDFSHISPLPIANLTWNKIEEGIYKLTWDNSPAKDIWYYNIYYSNIGQPIPTQDYLIASIPKSHTSYIDWQAQKGLLAYYLVTAVDRQGNEGIEDKGAGVAGDINGDGEVNMLDVQLCVNVVLGFETTSDRIKRAKEITAPEDKCDVLDVQEMVNKVLGGEG